VQFNALKINTLIKRKRAMAGSYAYFPKALLRLSPSDVNDAAVGILFLKID